MPEHDDLRNTLLDLTEPPTIPPDPAALVRSRVRRVRRRRGAFASAGVTAATAAAILVAGIVPSLLRAGPDNESPAASTTTGSHPTAPVSPTPTYNDPAQNAKLPPPWVDTPYEGGLRGYAYQPHPTLLRHGTSEGIEWNAISHTAQRMSEGCIAVESVVTHPNPAIIMDSCFGDWPAGRRAAWTVAPIYTGRKPDLRPLGSTFVFGAVSAAARSVMVKTAAGNQYPAEAIGTPTSDKLRFFLVVVPERDAKVTTVRPLTAAGTPARPPVGLPVHGGPCADGPWTTDGSTVTVSCGSASATPSPGN